MSIDKLMMYDLYLYQAKQVFLKWQFIPSISDAPIIIRNSTAIVPHIVYWTLNTWYHGMAGDLYPVNPLLTAWVCALLPDLWDYNKMICGHIERRISMALIAGQAFALVTDHYHHLKLPSYPTLQIFFLGTSSWSRYLILMSYIPSLAPFWNSLLLSKLKSKQNL